LTHLGEKRAGGGKGRGRVDRVHRADGQSEREGSAKGHCSSLPSRRTKQKRRGEQEAGSARGGKNVEGC